MLPPKTLGNQPITSETVRHCSGSTIHHEIIEGLDAPVWHQHIAIYIWLGVFHVHSKLGSTDKFLNIVGS